MIEFKDGDTFVVVHNDDCRVDFMREYPGYTGAIVHDFTDVGGLYYNNYYDYPLDGIGKNKIGYFRYWNSDSFRVYDIDPTTGVGDPYEIQEYTIDKLTTKQTIQTKIEHWLFGLLVSTNSDFNKKTTYRPQYLHKYWYKVCRPAIKILFRDKNP